MSRLALCGLLALAAAQPFVIDPRLPGRLAYDGHGALSAGASSRLLYDYEEPFRSQILDYLYKPKFGASLHHVKVEIGGDSQSTDGTEASHQHERSDMNCHRGYEWWLLEEARRRNPNVVTHVLSWAVPEWVGNDTYFSDDNIDYHLSWLKCARDQHPDVGSIDYMGIWNERPWGNTDWVKKFRNAMDKEGFSATRLVLPDRDWGEASNALSKIDADSEFGKALEGGAIGLHYPCNQPHPEVETKYGLKYWSSEDYSTEADWAGAGCWGRILNQNFVRMRMTSTISWSLVWSVYDDWPYFGNGLMYAYWPWSGHYTVNEAIWTSAHHCQFTEPGWSYVAESGSGSLSKGGSYVALVDPEGGNVTIVIEKLHGKCLRCAGQTTTAEEVSFRLTGLDHISKLSVWSTNSSEQFIHLDDATVDATGLVTISVEADSIVTLSSTSGQQKGSFGSPPEEAPFPLPYSDAFEARSPPQVAKYFADNGGSFELMEDPLRKGNKVLGQVVVQPPRKNAWVRDIEPVTILGDKSWGDDLAVAVDVMLHAAPNRSRFANVVSDHAGLCLDVTGKSQVAGAKVDLWNCVPDYNEQFLLDGGLLRISEDGGPSNFCVSAGPCPAGIDLCQGPCDGSPNQTWIFRPDRTLSVGGRCLEAVASDKSALLSTCNASSSAQIWRFSGTSSYAGLCLRVDGNGDERAGNCFKVHADGTWTITEDGKLLQTGELQKSAANWTRVSLMSEARYLKAYVDQRQVATVQTSLLRSGRVSLASGWNEAFFDDFSVSSQALAVV